MNNRNKYIAYLKKDIQLNLNYKFSFIMQFISPIFYLIIFYNISIFVSEGSALKPKDYFLYASIGVCLIDILSIIATSQAREIENLKISGVIEEIIFIDKNITSTFIAMSSYSIFLSIIKLIVYFLVISIFMGYFIVPFHNIIFLILTVTFLFFSFLGLALICGAYTLFFNKIGLLPILFVLLAVFFGKAYFPTNFLPNWLDSLSILFSFSHGIDNVRSLLIEETDFNEIMSNIAAIIFLSLCYFVCGWYAIKIALGKLIGKGNIESF